MDDKARYEVFKARQGRCHYCGTRLKWEAFEIRGLSGGWVIEEQQDGTKQALCYKCFEFPQRGKTAHRLTISEEQRPTAAAMGIEMPDQKTEPAKDTDLDTVQVKEPVQIGTPVNETVSDATAESTQVGAAGVENVQTSETQHVEESAQKAEPMQTSELPESPKEV